MTTGKLSRYPAVYSRILLALNDDGSPLEITLSSPDKARQERLDFYNFIKFVRRNRKECAHLFADNRANRVCIALQGSVLRFTLKGGKASDLEEAFAQAVGGHASMKHSEIPLDLIPEVSQQIADELSIPELDAPTEQVNPLDLLKQFNKEQDK